jgi:hypothetical protein
VASSATVEADATKKGDGGRIIIWSDIKDPKGLTTVGGHLGARGGSEGGNGGFIETSGFKIDFTNPTAKNVLEYEIENDDGKTERFWTYFLRVVTPSQ